MPSGGISSTDELINITRNALWREMFFGLPNKPSVVLVVGRILALRERQSSVAKCGRSTRSPKPKKNLAFADATQGVLL